MPKLPPSGDTEDAEEVDQKSAEGESPFEFEERFRRLLFDMGLSDINGGSSFVLGGHQIDACGGIDTHLFLFDCTLRRGGRSSTKQLRTKIQQWRGKYAPVLSAIRKHELYSTYKDVVLVIAANAQVSEADAKYGEEVEPKVHVLNRSGIEYLSEITNDIGPYAKYRFATLLGVRIARKSSDVPAIRVLSGGKSTFLFAAPARDLAELAFVPQAEAGFEFFYQRLIKRSKIRAISDYVVARPRPFPNSVVLATESEPRFEPKQVAEGTSPSGDSITIGMLRLPDQYGEFWVVDGQHRIYGSALSTEPPVLACTLIPASNLEKARYFLDINSEQTKIDSDLKWDLRAQLIPDQAEGRISTACQKMDEADGPLKGRIKIPHKGSTRARSVKLSGLCDAVLKNRLHETHQYRWSEKDFSALLAHDLNLWLVQVDSEVEEGVVKRRFLLENSGLSVLVILFKRIAQHLDHTRPSLQVLSTYAKSIATWAASLDPRDAVSLAKRCSSEGGRAEVADLVVSAMNEQLTTDMHLPFSGQMTRLVDDIIHFEGQLRSKLGQVFLTALGADWIEKSGLSKAGREPVTLDSLTLGQIRSLLSQEPFWNCVDEGFRDRGIKRDFALHMFDYVKDYRNAIEHDRAQDAKKLDPAVAESGLKTLRRGFNL